jgi:sensor histidine kinase YesM
MSDTELWWLTLGLGLVVAVVAWILLHMLYVSVKRIDSSVRGAWETATRVAANTATTWMLASTPEAVRTLDKELQEHDRLISEGPR